MLYRRVGTGLQRSGSNLHCSVPLIEDIPVMLVRKEGSRVGVQHGVQHIDENKSRGLLSPGLQQGLGLGMGQAMLERVVTLRARPHGCQCLPLCYTWLAGALPTAHLFHLQTKSRGLVPIAHVDYLRPSTLRAPSTLPVQRHS